MIANSKTLFQIRIYFQYFLVIKRTFLTKRNHPKHIAVSGVIQNII